MSAITGACNLIAAVICRDTEALHRYVTTRIGAAPGVRQLEISPILRRVKQAGTWMDGPGWPSHRGRSLSPSLRLRASDAQPSRSRARSAAASSAPKPYPASQPSAPPYRAASSVWNASMVSARGVCSAVSAFSTPSE